MPKLTEPGDIKDFSISSNSKNFSIDISPSVVEFRYFEGDPIKYCNCNSS